MNHSNDCKSKWRFKTQWMALAFAGLSIFTFSCDEESENKEAMAPTDLRYASVSEVYEGKAMETAQPVVFSSGKTNFEIVAGTAEEGGVYVEGEFQIVDTTGIINLKADNQLVAGTYLLDIKVNNSAGETVFPKAFELLVLPSAIEGLQYAPYTQTIVRGLEGQLTSVPVFKGSKPATFELKEESDFRINAETGEISLSLTSEINAGDYTLSVKVTNAGGETEFDDVVTIQVETTPEDLLYTPQAYLDIQQTQPKASTAPTVGGTAPFTFALKDDMGAFIIDENTGVISLPVDHTLAIDTYSLTVVASNAHGSTEFENAASFQIVKIEAVLPYDFAYTTNAYTVNEAFAFESERPTVSGSTPITFALVDDKGAFAIDENTGVISLLKGNTLAVGIYPLSVKATNEKGEVTFTDVMTVTIQVAVPEVIFTDGWDDVIATLGEKGLGNMTTVSIIGDPVQASNYKWTYGWGNWGVLDLDQVQGPRGAVIIPKKSENDDWLLAENVNLLGCVNAELIFAGYYKYGLDGQTLKLKVSEDFAGDVSTANWVEIPYEALASANCQERIIDLSQFDGKNITIALHHETLASSGINVDNATRNHCIYNFEVKAIRK